ESAVGREQKRPFQIEPVFIRNECLQQLRRSSSGDAENVTDARSIQIAIVGEHDASMVPSAEPTIECIDGRQCSGCVQAKHRPVAVVAERQTRSIEKTVKAQRKRVSQAEGRVVEEEVLKQCEVSGRIDTIETAIAYAIEFSVRPFAQRSEGPS